MTKLALITGGQQGIGLGIAMALKEAGFRIAIAAEAPENNPVVQAALANLGPDTRYFVHDLKSVDQSAALVARVGDLAPISAYVSNAGVPARTRADMLDITSDNFDHVIDINLRGGFFLAQAVARAMLAAPAAGYRSMTFITSVSAAMASIERAEYCISKAGASMMAANFALRLAPHDIGVFELRPGIVDTPMTEAVHDRYSARIALGLVPARRWGQPQDIGQIMVPLALGHMAFATGAVIPVDGGLSIARL